MAHPGRHITRAAALALALTTLGGSAPAHAQHLADGKVMTIRLNTRARVFDMSTPGSEAPPGWTAPNFDDLSWDHAVIAKPTCHTFAVTDSAVEKNIALHPKVVDHGLLTVEQYLHPGRNVLTGKLETYGGCNGLDDSITLRMTGLQRPNALALSWHSVPGETRYYLQVWLVKAAPGQTITPDSEVNIATQTTEVYYILDAAAMPSGTYQWRTAAVNARGALISRWTPAQTVTLN